jgi:hypothetical protein
MESNFKKLPENEIAEFVSNWVSQLSYTYGLKHSSVAKLLQNHSHFKRHWQLAIIRFYASHEKRIASIFLYYFINNFINNKS